MNTFTCRTLYREHTPGLLKKQERDWMTTKYVPGKKWQITSEISEQTFMMLCTCTWSNGLTFTTELIHKIEAQQVGHLIVEFSIPSREKSLVKMQYMCGCGLWSHIWDVYIDSTLQTDFPLIMRYKKMDIDCHMYWVESTLNWIKKGRTSWITHHRTSVKETWARLSHSLWKSHHRWCFNHEERHASWERINSCFQCAVE